MGLGLGLGLGPGLGLGLEVGLGLGLEVGVGVTSSSSLLAPPPITEEWPTAPLSETLGDFTGGIGGIAIGGMPC